MTHQDFIAAILAEPNDDTPRLIYADWLEQRGDPRAEFIRAQVELATLAAPPERQRVSMYGNPMPRPRKGRGAEKRFEELRRRQLDLLHTHCKEWVEPLIGDATGVIFVKGCIEGFSTLPQTFADHAAVWYQSMPIRQLCISGFWSTGNDVLFPLLESPLLSNLRTLDLGYAGLQESQIEALANSTSLANLEELFLGYTRVNQELLQKLRQSPTLKNVQIQA